MLLKVVDDSVLYQKIFARFQFDEWGLQFYQIRKRIAGLVIFPDTNVGKGDWQSRSARALCPPSPPQWGEKERGEGYVKQCSCSIMLTL